MINNVRFVLCAALVATVATESARSQRVLHEQHGYLGTEMDPRTDYTGFVRIAEAERYLAIFRADDSIGWGRGLVAPLSQREIYGVNFIVADENAATPGVFFVTLQGEDPANPGRPALALQTLRIVQLQSPGGSSGVQAYHMQVTWPTPVSVSRNGDLFLGMQFPRTLGAGDRMFPGLLSGSDQTGSPAGSTNWDIANSRTADTGHGLGPVGGFTYRLDQIALPNVYYFRDEQLMITPLSIAPSFALGATTNQTTMPGSNPGGTPGYTTSFFSAYQPSLINDRTGASRSDDPAFLYHNDNYTGSETVTILMAPLGLGSNPVWLGQILPGSTGTFCLDLTVAPIPVDVGVTTNGIFESSLAIPASARSGLLGLALGFSAIGLDAAAGTVAAGSCNLMSF